MKSKLPPGMRAWLAANGSRGGIGRAKLGKEALSEIAKRGARTRRRLREQRALDKS